MTALGPLADGVHPRLEAGGCIFCDFAAAPATAFREKLVLLVQPHALVCLNAYPFAAAHLLVVPRRHVAEPGDLRCRRIRRGHAPRARGDDRGVKAATGPEGINVGLNLGKAAGAGIAEHLHAHVVPRWDGDTNFMPVLADVRVMPEHLDATWVRMEPLFADLPGVHPVEGAARG